MEQAAGKAARDAPAGIDGLTVSMVDGLRTMGSLWISIKRWTARRDSRETQGENEARQLRYNAVMREAPKIQGAAAAATGSAEERDRLEKRLPEQVDDFDESRAVDGLPGRFGRDELVGS